MQKSATLFNEQEYSEILDRLDVYTTCQWPVAQYGYEVGQGWIKTVRERPEWHIQHPLEDYDLFETFARLGALRKPPEEKLKKQLKDWVDRFGLPLKKDESNPNPAISYDRPRDDEPNAVMEMPVDTFLEHARQARNCLDLYRDIKHDRVDRIWDKAKKPRSTLDSRLNKLFFSSNYESDVEERKEPSNPSEIDEFLWDATAILAEDLSSRLTNVRLVVAHRDQTAALNHSVPLMQRRLEGQDSPERWPLPPPELPGLMRSSWCCPDLLSAIYFQFSLVVCTYKPERRCQNAGCGKRFTPERSDQKFCGQSCRSSSRNFR